ncbi:MAG: HypC/HybG/HupF family hydrogenase formation chaperone [Coriobacteriales bacterium]|jgi:hydrogenase expression/formation protein HypC|nr:HypC/HybG/HupF family hydrogenase formation chaperone [Coriobacteriales bacterium]
MCLAIPAQILSIDEGRVASVSILGVSRAAALDLVPQAELGDYVLVHAGYAIEIIDERMARETLDLIAEFPELADQGGF